MKTIAKRYARVSWLKNYLFKISGLVSIDRLKNSLINKSNKIGSKPIFNSEDKDIKSLKVTLETYEFEEQISDLAIFRLADKIKLIIEKLVCFLKERED